MSCILNIDTSTNVCSVVVGQDGTCVFDKQDTLDPEHREKLGTPVDETLAFIDNNSLSLDVVAVSGGPGSYIGLHVGVSTAKGVCYGRGVKLLAVPTLELLAVPVLLRHGEVGENALFTPMIDARHMEVYSAVYDRALKEVRGIQADVVDENTYKEYLDRDPVYFFGNGAEKCIEIINHPNAHLIKDIDALAKNMFPLTEKRIAQERFEDIAYFVPFYLKDLVAKQTKPLL